jgi:ABC-type sugar transport system ATPase subunit
MVNEDRRQYGLVPCMAVKHNVTLSSLRRYCRGPFIRHVEETRAAVAEMEDLAVRSAGPGQKASELSGGNQQKVVLAKALLAEPSVLILDEPTRGVDVGAKAEIHALIRRLAHEGRAVLLISSEMNEVLSLSDRILVMREGEMAAELPGGAAAEAVLREAMPGPERGQGSGARDQGPGLGTGENDEA